MRMDRNLIARIFRKADAARGSGIGTMLLACTLLGSTPDRSSAEERRLPLCRYDRVFSEDFDRLSVSPWNAETARWIAHTPWNGDFGDARFIDPRDDGPFFVKDGILTIEARKHEGDKWTSGLLASADPTTAGFAQQYGYFEARMKLPAGPGIWPAFWLAANAGPKDKTPAVEIDVVEHYGKFPGGFTSTVHVWGKQEPRTHREQHAITNVPSGSLSAEFHTYGAEVSKDWIVFYLDRLEVSRIATPPEHDKPLLLLVNLALGSGWPIDQTPNPSRLLVDYIHTYSPDPGKADARCPE